MAMGRHHSKGRHAPQRRTIETLELVDVTGTAHRVTVDAAADGLPRHVRHPVRHGCGGGCAGRARGPLLPVVRPDSGAEDRTVTAERPAPHIPDAPHGTLRGYSLGCRCPLCRSAKQATMDTDTDAGTPPREGPTQ